MHCRNRFTLMFVLFAALGGSLLGFGGEARGETVYSNLGPGDTYNTASSNSLGGSSISSRDLAVRFLSGTTASLLDSADIPLVHTSGTNVIAVELWSDAGGTPSSSLISANPALTLASSTFPAPSVYNANFGGTFVLQPNTIYWLVANAESDFHGGWHFSSTAKNPVYGGFAARLDSGPWSYNAANTDLAYRINGTAIAAVPTPQAAMGGLALLAGLGLGSILRKRRTGHPTAVAPW